MIVPRVSVDKQQILDENGFVYHPKTFFINQKLKLVFDIDTLFEHDENWLQQKIDEPSEEWRFYFGLAFDYID